MTDEGKQVVSGWHVDRRVSISHLIATAGMLVSIIFWSIRLESRIEVNSLKIEEGQRIDVRTDIQMQNQYAEIIRRLERLDDKTTTHLREHAAKP